MNYTYSQAKASLTRHPAWLFPAVSALKEDADMTAEQRLELQRRVAASVGDSNALLRAIGDVGNIFDDFYPDSKPANPDTDDTISAFLERFAPPGSTPSDDQAELDRMMGIPTDYAASLETSMEETEAETEALPADSTSRLLDGILPKQKSATKSEEISKNEASNTSLTEGFARMMIKNGNYSKALEIISALNLNNPGKSAYFADQIRFLRKLIINENKISK